MEELSPGTMVLMVKNEDGSFSPVGMSKEQAYIVNAFLSKMSEESAMMVKYGEKYEKKRY